MKGADALALRQPDGHATVSNSAVNRAMVVNMLWALLAIVLGNAIYFAILPSLPPIARHHPPHLDLGVLIDFWICLVAYGLIRTVRKWR